MSGESSKLHPISAAFYLRWWIFYFWCQIVWLSPQFSKFSHQTFRKLFEFFWHQEPNPDNCLEAASSEFFEVNSGLKDLGQLRRCQDGFPVFKGSASNIFRILFCFQNFFSLHSFYVRHYSLRFPDNLHIPFNNRPLPFDILFSNLLGHKLLSSRRPGYHPCLHDWWSHRDNILFDILQIYWSKVWLYSHRFYLFGCFIMDPCSVLWWVACSLRDFFDPLILGSNYYNQSLILAASIEITTLVLWNLLYLRNKSLHKILRFQVNLKIRSQVSSMKSESHMK